MKILLPIDGSFYSQNAVKSLAQCGCELSDQHTIILVNVVRPVLEQVNAELTDYELMGTRFGKVLLREFYDSESFELFEKVRGELNILHCKIEEITLAGNPADRIAEVAEKMNVDLIVMGSHGKSALRTMVFGSVTEGVMSRTKKPVLLVRGVPIQCNDEPKIGVAIGGSDYDTAIGHFIKRHRPFFGRNPHFTLIHVIEKKYHMHCRCNQSDAERNEEHRKQFEEAVAPIVPLLREADVHIKDVCLMGDVVKSIEKYVSEKRLDMLIMGSHGHRRFDLSLLGSTTVKIAEMLDVPLLIVHNE